MPPIRRIVSDFRELRPGQVPAELMLLIVGILSALAVNGWIEDRRDARTEGQYLERLVQDLDQDLGILDEFAAFEKAQVEDGIEAYRMTRRTTRFTRATYSDLVGTGNRQPIRNGALRNRIIGVYEGNERLTAITDRNNRSYIDQMYSMYLVDSGLVGMRVGSSLKPIDTTNRDLAARLGLPPAAPENRRKRRESRYTPPRREKRT